MLISSPNLAQMMQNVAKFRVLGKKNHMTQLFERPDSNILSWQEVATKFDQMEKTDGDKSHLYVENTLVLESSHKPNHWELFQQAQLSDRSLIFIL